MPRIGIFVSCLIFVFIGICTAIQAAEKDLAAYWAFDEGEGNIAEDLSGNGNVGNITGAFDWVEGIIGMGIECKGGTTVNCGMGKSLRIPQDITTEFWIKPAETIDSDDARINVLYMASGPMFAFSSSWGQDGALTHWYDGPSPRAKVHSKTKKWQEGEWYHIVGTYSGSLIKLYVNGEEQASEACEGDILKREQPLNIGGTYKGIIDEVRIYSRALSENEVGRSYRHGLSGGEAVDASGKFPLTWGQIKGMPDVR